METVVKQWYWRQHWWGFRLYVRTKHGDILAYYSETSHGFLQTEQEAQLLVDASVLAYL